MPKKEQLKSSTRILQKNMPTKPRKKSVWVRVVLWSLTLATAIAAAVGVYVFAIFLKMPPMDSLLKETRRPSITFTDRDGYEIRSTNKIMGTPLATTSVPPYVWQSIIAVEDKRFFDHGAIDLRGIVRAAFGNLRAGAIVSGGSTLTQQVAKNIFLNRERTISRKVQELIFSYWLENRFSKTQIIDLYMNRVSLVKGMRGIDAAAREIFQKTASDLTLAEAAQIAAMLKAPATYSPIKNPDKNIARARTVLTEMVRQKYITLAAAQDAAAHLFPITESAADTNIFRYWTDYVTDEVTSRIGDNVDDDLIVYTTLDPDLQERAAFVLKRHAADVKDDVKPQGAVIAMSRDGAIRAMVGGINYQGSQFNRTTAMRQPGSTFKVVVYLVALENGLTPDAIMWDAPFSIGDYNPKNYNEKYYGQTTIANAFAKSMNSIPLQLTEQFGINAVVKMAGRLGVGAKLRREYSTVLGASEMTLIELTTVYDVVWNDGYSVQPYVITKIVTPTGRVLYDRTPSDAARLLAPQTVSYMQQMLAGVMGIAGTGRRGAVPGLTLGGKTGTSSEYRDAWFVGAIKDKSAADDGRLTIGIWIGHDDFTPMNNITGGTVPAEIFHDIVQ